VSTIKAGPAFLESSAANGAVDPIELKRLTPVRVWAVIGLFFVLLQAYVYIRWFGGPDFHRPSTGSDPVPTVVKFWAWLVQISTMVAIVGAIWWVVRQVRRERRLTFDAILLIAWSSVMWQDPVLNYIRPTFFYNSYLISFGSWVEGIPGWISPNGGNLPSPLFMSGVGYLACLFFSIGITAAMRAAKRRIPSMGVPGLLVVAFVTAFFMDMAYEVFMCRTSLYAYNGTIHSVSLWGGERYQFPLYESVFWGFVWASSGALRYFRDDKGRSIVERGAEALTVSQRTQTGYRTFAVIGFLNVMYLIFNICINFAALQIDQTPTGYPTYLRNGMCGAGTEYACPGPEVPIPMSPGAVNQPDPASTG
jgi:Spirocyclase AveC-like